MNVNRENIAYVAAPEAPVRLEIATWPMANREQTGKVSTLSMDPEIDRVGFQPPLMA